MRKVFLICILLSFFSVQAFSFDDPPGGGCVPSDDVFCDDDEVEVPLDNGVVILVGITIAYVIVTLRKNLNTSSSNS